VKRPLLPAEWPSAPGLVLALAIPALFLHERYNPGVSVGSGSTEVSVELSDLAIVAVLTAATYVLAARRPSALRCGRSVWIATGGLLTLVLAGTLYGPAVTDGYPLGSSLISAVKFIEYAVLVVAVPVLVTRNVDRQALLTAIVAWSSAASTWGALQFLGLVDEFEGRRPGQREPSFLGVHDFAALSAAALSVGLVALAFGTHGHFGRARCWFALVAGSLGVVIAGALASVGAVVLGIATVAVAARRRDVLTRTGGFALAAVAAFVLAGSFAIRSADLDALLRFVGIAPAEAADDGVQSYSHRTVLTYIGVRIFADHPLLGVGWQGSALEPSYAPYLEDARQRYPSVSEESLPSPQHSWGVQNAFVQAGADLGLGGLLSLVAVFLTGVLTARRAYIRGPPEALVPLLWLVVAAAELAALGLFAGSPINALLWLGLGLAVASRAVAAESNT
jgi:hypothetical protein